MDKCNYINDSIHGLISLSDFEKKIISHPAFNRLHDIYLNSTVYLTFPSDRTKRFEHSIGTMKLCSEMFYRAVLNTDNITLNSFLTLYQNKICEIIKKLLDSNGFERTIPVNLKLGKIEGNPFYNSLIPYNITKQYKDIYLILILSIRGAALLHDIGHPPFSHVIEESLNDIYENQCPIHNTKESYKSYIETLKAYDVQDKDLHEKIGIKISEIILKSTTSGNIHNFDDNIFSNTFIELIISECIKHILTDDQDFEYLHTIIDGTIDGDRLDYITRDTTNSGVKDGRINYLRTINEIRIAKNESRVPESPEYVFAFPIKALSSIEDVLMSRFNLYEDVIYHHRVVKMNFLLKNSVTSLIDAFLKNSKKPINKSSCIIPFDISGLWFPLSNLNDSDKIDALSQWNDSWLMTILKQLYFLNYKDKEDPLSRQLSELLLNKKNYSTLIKRHEDFQTLDDALSEIIKESLIDNRELFESLENINVFLDLPEGFYFNEFYFYYMEAFKGQEATLKFENDVKECINGVLKSKGCLDSIIIFSTPSIGMKKGAYLYDTHDEKIRIRTLDEVSHLKSQLRLEISYLPIFYIFIDNKSELDIIKNKQEILQAIGKELGTKLLSIINEDESLFL